MTDPTGGLLVNGGGVSPKFRGDHQNPMGFLFWYINVLEKKMKTLVNQLIAIFED